MATHARTKGVVGRGGSQPGRFKPANSGRQPVDARLVASVASMLARGESVHDIMAQLDLSLPTLYLIRRGEHPHQLDGTVRKDPFADPEDPHGIPLYEVEPQALALIEANEEVDESFDVGIARLMKIFEFSKNAGDVENVENLIIGERQRTFSALRRKRRHAEIAAQKRQGEVNVEHKRAMREAKNLIAQERTRLLADLQCKLDLMLSEAEMSIARKQKEFERKEAERIAALDLEERQTYARFDRIAIYGLAHADCECHPYEEEPDHP